MLLVFLISHFCSISNSRKGSISLTELERSKASLGAQDTLELSIIASLARILLSIKKLASPAHVSFHNLPHKCVYTKCRTSAILHRLDRLKNRVDAESTQFSCLSITYSCAYYNFTTQFLTYLLINRISVFKFRLQSAESGLTDHMMQVLVN